jgi:glutamyl-tRNA synthetase
MIKEIRTRFAPSPTGYMHIGNLRTALYAYLYAKNNNGKFILRIEDTDAERYVEGAVEIILSTLKKVGMDYDEGPIVGGPYGPYVQSQRKNEYMKYALQLVEKGEAYYCFCDKERLENLPDVNGARKYDKHCLHLSKEEIKAKLDVGVPFVIRQNMPAEGKTKYHDMVFGDIEIDNSELEDNILIKSDGMPTYNFANVIDDHLMNITVVIRGQEYLSSTPKYNLLYKAFGWEQPLYMHLPPIMKDAQHKLSKRNGDASFEDLLKKGFLTEAIVNYIALLGWSPKGNEEKLSMQELKETFSVEGISKSQSIFDEQKLRWLNGRYIKELPFDEFVKLATPYLDQSKVAGKYDYAKLCKLVQSRIDTLSDIAGLVDFLEEFDKFDGELYFNKKLKTDAAVAKRVLPHVIQKLSALTQWDETSIHDALIGLVAELEVKNGIVLWPTRVAISGKASTPGGATELADLLGKEETLRRLDFAIGLLQ